MIFRSATALGRTSYVHRGGAHEIERISRVRAETDGGRSSARGDVMYYYVRKPNTYVFVYSSRTRVTTRRIRGYTSGNGLFVRRRDFHRGRWLPPACGHF